MEYVLGIPNAGDPAFINVAVFVPDTDSSPGVSYGIGTNGVNVTSGDNSTFAQVLPGAMEVTIVLPDPPQFRTATKPP